MSKPVAARGFMSGRGPKPALAPGAWEGRSERSERRVLTPIPPAASRGSDPYRRSSVANVSRVRGRSVAGGVMKCRGSAFLASPATENGRRGKKVSQVRRFFQTCDVLCSDLRRAKVPREPLCAATCDGQRCHANHSVQRPATALPLTLPWRWRTPGGSACRSQSSGGGH